MSEFTFFFSQISHSSLRTHETLFLASAFIDVCVLFWQNAQRLAAGAQVAQTLTTPVVSVATPSLLAQGLPFSAMPTAYNTGELNTQALQAKKEN